MKDGYHKYCQCNPRDRYIRLMETEYRKHRERDNVKSFISLLSHFLLPEKKKEKSSESSVHIFFSEKNPGNLYAFKVRKADEKLRKSRRRGI